MTSVFGFSQEEGRPPTPTVRLMRLSRILRTPDSPGDDERVPIRRMLLWIIVAAAILAGIMLYFKYERQLTPIVG